MLDFSLVVHAGRTPAPPNPRFSFAQSTRRLLVDCLTCIFSHTSPYLQSRESECTVFVRRSQRTLEIAWNYRSCRSMRSSRMDLVIAIYLRHHSRAWTIASAVHHPQHSEHASDVPRCVTFAIMLPELTPGYTIAFNRIIRRVVILECSCMHLKNRIEEYALFT